MANKNEENIETSNSSETPSSSGEQSEPTTSKYHIKDGSIEKFTKVRESTICTNLFQTFSSTKPFIFGKDGMALIIDATKHTNAFPSNASRNLYSAYPAFNRAIQRHSDQILSMISKVVKLQHIKGNIQR